MPEEFKHIVKDTKIKDENKTFKTINYMKLSVVLWKGLQETLDRVDKLEAKIQELEKPKAKAKSKTEN